MNNMNTSKIIACGATLLLSSCGIYTSYEPQTSVPENLYGEEVTVSDTASMETSTGGISLQTLICRS